MYLDAIVARHRRTASRDDRETSGLVARCAALGPTRGFRQALAEESRHRLAVIAEVKRRSPSKGDLLGNRSIDSLVDDYVAGGARCVSVLTDSESFGGSVEDLQVVSERCGLPVIRKDFTVSLNDVVDARLMGADCVLLIAAVLSRSEMTEMIDVARLVGIDVLVETHDEREVELAVELGADLIGVNQRDLVTFEVDHERVVRTARSIPSDVVKVAESGVRGPGDARSLRDAGYDAVLVGESLVTASSPREALEALRVR